MGLEEAVKKLTDLGVFPRTVAENFSYDDPSSIFSARHESEYPQQVINAFSQRANQYALDHMRKWLGVQEDQLE